MLLIPLVLVLGACDGDGLSGLRPGESTVPGDAPVETAPPDENPAPTAPPATDAPETAPPPGTDAPETAPPEDPDDGEGRSWGPILAILIGLAALIAIMAALSKRRKPAAPPRPDPRRQLVSTARWIHDQLSLEILALPAADSQQRWNAERVASINSPSISGRRLRKGTPRSGRTCPAPCPPSLRRWTRPFACVRPRMSTSSSRARLLRPRTSIAPSCRPGWWSPNSRSDGASV